MNIQNIDLAILFGQGPVGVIGVLSITIVNYMCTLCTGSSITWPTDLGTSSKCSLIFNF